MSLIKEAEKYLGADQAEKYRLMDYYNNNCYPFVDAKRKYKIQRGDNWCAMFTTVIANRCGLNSTQFPYEVSVMQQLKWGLETGRFTREFSETKAGDLILYSWKANGHCDHVGMVVRFELGKLLVIEGNKSDTVAYRRVSLESPQVYGYIRVGAQDGLEDGTVSEGERIAMLGREVMRGRYGVGGDRQKLLGDDYPAVQAWINSNY